MQPYHKQILKSKKWRDWWIKTLLARHNRLIDLETQEPMHIDKRVFIEIPRLNDYLDFFCSFGVRFTIKPLKDEILMVLLMKGNSRIIKHAKDSLTATQAALVDYLKESSLHEKWE